MPFTRLLTSWDYLGGRDLDDAMVLADHLGITTVAEALAIHDRIFPEDALVHGGQRVGLVGRVGGLR